MLTNEDKTLVVYGVYGRDTSKTFTIREIDPLTLSGYVLRLVSALKVASYEALLAQLQAASEEGRAPIDAIMQLLQGADPQAVHVLLHDLLDYVQITPDPQHPGVLRPLLKDDIREIKTLGDVLMGIVKLNFNFGG